MMETFPGLELSFYLFVTIKMSSKKTKEELVTAEEIKKVIEGKKKDGMRTVHKFYKINDNDYKNKNGEPLFVYSGPATTNQANVRELSPDAVDYLKSVAENNVNAFPVKMMQKLNPAVTSNGFQYIPDPNLQGASMKKLLSKVKVIGTGIEGLKDLEPAVLRKLVRAVVLEDPEPVEGPNENNVKYEGKTAAEIALDLPMPESNPISIAESMRELENKLHQIDLELGRLEGSEAVLSEFSDYNESQLKIVRYALTKKLTDYGSARINTLADFYSEKSDTFKEAKKVYKSGKKLTIEQYNQLIENFNKDLTTMSIPLNSLEPEMKDLIKSLVQTAEPLESADGRLLTIEPIVKPMVEPIVKPIVEPIVESIVKPNQSFVEPITEQRTEPLATGSQQLTTGPVTGPPPLEDINPASGPLMITNGDPEGPEGPEGPFPQVPNGSNVSVGPDGPDAKDQTTTNLAVVVPGKYQPRYHKRIIKEFFGSDVNPDWDKSLTTVIFSENMSKEQIIEDIEDIIGVYGKKLLIKKRLSPGDIHEYHELRQLVFCWKRNLQKGSRSQMAQVKLGDLINLATSDPATTNQGPINSSAVPAELAKTANANIPFYTVRKMTKEMPEPVDSQKGKYLDPRIVRPKVYAEAFTF